MPFALLFIGAVMIAAGVRNKTDELYSLAKGDIEGGYIKWIVAILILGSLGYVEDLRTFSRAMMVLVLVVLFLKAGNPQTGSGGGFFSQFFSSLNIAPQTSTGTSGTSNSITGNIPIQSPNILSTAQIESTLPSNNFAGVIP